jgi:spore germination cell wall hydrolase CwlJ-like protein
MMMAASCVPSASASNAPVPTVIASGSLAKPLHVQLRQAQPQQPLWQRAASLFAGIAPSAAQPFEDDAQSEADKTRSLDCLTAAIYYEARSESDDGQRAVAQVVLNRVRHPAFPNTVCGVVYQGSTRRTGCQFTFTCDGSLARRPEAVGWFRARRIAAEALAGDVYAPVGNATHYHTTSILPYWASSLIRSAVIGAHIFYRWGGSEGRAPAFNQHYAGVEPTPAVWNRPIDLRRPALAPQLLSASQISRDVTRWQGDGGAVTIHRSRVIAPVATASASPVEAEYTPPAKQSGVQIHRSTSSSTS